MADFWIYLFILVSSTYLIRAVPFACVKRTIENTFVKSFLYYIPYTVLAAMTFPSVIYSTGNVISGIVGLTVGALFAFFNRGLTLVAVCASGSALICELVLMLIK